MDNNNLYGADNNGVPGAGDSQQNGNPYEQQPYQGQQGNPYDQQPNQIQQGNPYDQQPNQIQQGNPYDQQPNQIQQGNPYGQQPNQGQQGNPYEQQNYYSNIPQEPQKDKASGMAIASMVCGILSIVLCCVWYISIILSIVAITLGIINMIKKYGGKGMAIAGIITGSFGVVLSILMMFGFIFASYMD